MSSFRFSWFWSMHCFSSSKPFLMSTFRAFWLWSMLYFRSSFVRASILVSELLVLLQVLLSLLHVIYFRLQDLQHIFSSFSRCHGWLSLPGTWNSDVILVFTTLSTSFVDICGYPWSNWKSSQLRLHFYHQLYRF